jgi:hypothetical protein
MIPVVSKDDVAASHSLNLTHVLEKRDISLQACCAGLGCQELLR